MTGSRPRPLGYFQRMWDAMRAEGGPDRIRLYLAHHEGRLLAATTWVRVGRSRLVLLRRLHERRSRAASEQRHPVAMIEDAHAAGARVYDLRGITDTLDSDDPLFGLIQFKVGTGGEAVEYVGEWDYPLNRRAPQGVHLLHGTSLTCSPSTSRPSDGAPTWRR